MQDRHDSKIIHLNARRASRNAPGSSDRPKGFVRLDEIGPRMDRQLAASDTDMVAAHAEFHGGQDGTLDWFSTDCVMHEVLMGRMFFHCCYRPDLVAMLAAYDWMVGQGRESPNVVISMHRDGWVALESREYVHWSMPDEAFEASRHLVPQQ